jgi:hypothetical protein
VQRLVQPMERLELLEESRVLVVSELELQSKPKGQCMQLSGWSICRRMFWTWTCGIPNRGDSNNIGYSKDCELGVITKLNA